MTLEELVRGAVLKATGKIRDLNPGSQRYERTKAIANQYLDDWQNEPGVDWNSLYNPYTECGEIIPGGATYSLPPSARKFSNTPYDNVIVRKDGQDHEFLLVGASELKRNRTGNYVAKSGKKLIFNRDFTAEDQLVGGKILAPSYRKLEKLEEPDSIVEIDEPQWLLVRTAAEIIRNDTTKQNQYGNLIAEANELMRKMIEDNGGQQTMVFMPWTSHGGV